MLPAQVVAALVAGLHQTRLGAVFAQVGAALGGARERPVRYYVEVAQSRLVLHFIFIYLGLSKCGLPEN